MEPLFFEPIYKETVWGGSHLSQLLNRDIPSEHTGESWEIACHDNGTSMIANGEYKGKPLSILVEEQSVALLGPKFQDTDKFPLLVKFIDANDKLSIQVHPDDVYANEHAGGELGKTEMWYILEAKKGAKLVYGIPKHVSKEQFKEGILTGTLEEYVNEIEVEAGDVVHIPSGTLHAIEDGIVLAEIQQNSDTTYRVYDWNRMGLDGKPRPLHVEDALNVIDFEGKIFLDKVKGLPVESAGYTLTYYIANKYFAMEKLTLRGEMLDDTSNINFYLYTCVDGEGIIEYNNTSLQFEKGQSFMIPADLGSYALKGDALLLRSYVPDEKSYIDHLEQQSGQKLGDIKHLLNIEF